MSRGSQVTGLDPRMFVFVGIGAVAAGIVLLGTLFTWSSYVTSQTVMGTPIVEGEWIAGISYVEGKLVFIGILAALVALGLGLLNKTWLPTACVIAGSVGAFAAVILIALRGRLAAVIRAAQGEAQQLESSCRATR